MIKEDFCTPDAKSCLTGKDPGAGRLKAKGGGGAAAEEEMVRAHHQLNGHESE